MKCGNCGRETADDATFCDGCGHQLAQGAGGQGQEGPMAADPAAREAIEPEQTCYEKGCLASAWDDLRASDGWLGTILLLGLIMCVPILNFAVVGYAVAWSADMARGERYQMPDHIFADGTFKLGFLVFVLGLLFSIVIGLVDLVLGLIPILGQVASIALTIGCTMAVSACAVRIGLAKSLGAGFQLGEVWAAAKKEPGKLFCASYLPSLIIAAAFLAVALTVSLAVLLASGAGLAAVGASSSAAMGSLGVLGGVLIVALGYLLAACAALGSVLSYRATGHWASRYAPEWGEQLR